MNYSAVLALLFFSVTAAAVDIKNPTSFRAVTFNLYNRPFERQARLEAARTLLRDLNADIVALQEVSTGWILPGDPIQILNRSLEMSVSRFWHETNLSVFQTGIAILSQYEILESNYNEFNAYPFWDAKGFVFAKIQTPKGVIGVVNLHMSSTTNTEIEAIKDSQFRQISAFLSPFVKEMPVLVLGDFNEDVTTERFQKFLKDFNGEHLFQHLPPEKSHNTWSPSYNNLCSSSAGGERVDYLVSLPAKSGAQLKFLGGEIVVPKKHPHPSDHCPVYADISLKP